MAGHVSVAEIFERQINLDQKGQLL